MAQSSPSTGTSLVAENRTEFGKGAARRVRRAHKIPAVLYGHGTAPRHLSLPGHDTMLALKTRNALLSLQFEGGEITLAIAKDVQIDPVRREIEHLDLVIVKSGERVEVSVPVHVVGTAESETVVTLEQSSLTITAEATHLPEAIVVSVEGVAAGTHITAGSIELPEGTAYLGDPELTVVAVMAAASAAAADAELAAAEAEAGIVHEASDAELASRAASA